MDIYHEDFPYNQLELSNSFKYKVIRDSKIAVSKNHPVHNHITIAKLSLVPA